MTIDHNAAAAEVARHWKAGSKMDVLPAAWRPLSLEDGYRVQAALPQALGSAVLGWKIAATAKKGQDHIGVNGPIAGRLLADRVLQPDRRCPLQGNRMRVAECEFVFRLGADLPARDTPYTRAEVLEAVAELRPGLELPDSRFSDFTRAGAAQLAADDACAHYFILGEPASNDWRRLDLAAHATSLSINAREVTRGSGADVLGHPLDALCWLANNHAVQGTGLHAGQLVTTGVSGTPSPISEGDVVVADLGILGRVGTMIGD